MASNASNCHFANTTYLIFDYEEIINESAYNYKIRMRIKGKSKTILVPKRSSVLYKVRKRIEIKAHIAHRKGLY